MTVVSQTKRLDRLSRRSVPVLLLLAALAFAMAAAYIAGSKSMPSWSHSQAAASLREADELVWELGDEGITASEFMDDPSEHDDDGFDTLPP